MPDYLGEICVISLAALGWAVMTLLVLVVPVSPSAQLVFYVAGFVGLSATFALVLELYHARSGELPRRRAFQLLGSGMRLAFVIMFALWLQSLRVLTVVYAGLLGVGFLILEFLFHQLASGTRQTEPE